MTSLRTCRHCGGGPTTRHALRTVDVPVIDSPVWGWLAAEIVRLKCPACRRTTEAGRDLADASLGIARRALVEIFDASGPTEAVRRSGLDVRTVVKWVDRALDDGLDHPLPDAVRILSAGPKGPVVVLDAGTGIPFDAAPLETEALAACLRRHGGIVTAAWISLDAHVRDAVEAACPAADIRAEATEGSSRLSVIANRLHATGRVPETSLMLDEVSRLGWRPPMVEALRRLCLRHGAKRAATYLALWGDVIEFGLVAAAPSSTDVSRFSEWSPRRFRAALLVRGMEMPLVPDALSNRD